MEKSYGSKTEDKVYVCCSWYEWYRMYDNFFFPWWQDISALLEKQKVEIAHKKKEVMADLEKVEPAVIDAQQAVKSIRKQHLVEVRSMANPPPVVKLALESICLLLGEVATDWKSIRSVIMKDNFIPTIVNFDTEYISDDVREMMNRKYMSNPDYNFEKVCILFSFILSGKMRCLILIILQRMSTRQTIASTKR